MGVCIHEFNHFCSVMVEHLITILAGYIHHQTCSYCNIHSILQCAIIIFKPILF